MEDRFDILIDVLEISIKINGKDKPITLNHLLNILKRVSNISDKQQNKLNKTFDPNWD